MSAPRRVYSTDHGRTCPTCGKALDACRCESSASRPHGDGVLRVSHSSKGRKGRTVTLVEGVPLAGEELKSFAKALKAACGAGGAVKDGVIEVQGDHRETVIPLLEARGWTVKRKGG